MAHATYSFSLNNCGNICSPLGWVHLLLVSESNILFSATWRNSAFFIGSAKKKKKRAETKFL